MAFTAGDYYWTREMHYLLFCFDDTSGGAMLSVPESDFANVAAIPDTASGLFVHLHPKLTDEQTATVDYDGEQYQVQQYYYLHADEAQAPHVYCLYPRDVRDDVLVIPAAYCKNLKVAA